MKKALIISLVITAVILVGVVYLMFFYESSVNAELNEDNDTLRVTSPMVDVTLSKDAIYEIRIDLDFDRGVRTNGFGSSSISSGEFTNNEFGKYTLASYVAVRECIVVEHTNGAFVFNQSTLEETQQFFDKLTLWFY